MARSPFIRPSTTMKCFEPLALIAETATAALHYLRLQDRCPGGPTVVLGADPRFVAEEDLSPFLLGQLLNGRELNLAPVLDRLRVLLIGAIQRGLFSNLLPGAQQRLTGRI